MRVRIQVVVEPESDAVPVVHEVATLERDGLQPEGLGLTLGGRPRNSLSIPRAAMVLRP
jgi:hypothetical protein